MSSTPTILLRGPGREWTVVGTDPVGAGIVAEGLSVSANESGPDTVGFQLRRRSNRLYPDLASFTEADVWIDGVPVWGGRIWEAPLSDGGDDVISVQGRGWQYHLDDDVVDLGWVHTDLTDWRSVRSFPGVGLTSWPAAAEASVGAGIATVGWGNGLIATNATASGIMLDCGPNRRAARIAVNWSAFNPNGFASMYARASNTPEPLTGTISDAFSGKFNVVAADMAGTFGSPQRYLSLFMYRDDGATGATGFDHIMRINAVKVFWKTRDESGFASILKASDVVKDVLASGVLPQLNPSTSRIAATSFSIPAFWPDKYRTPRELFAAVNAYENRLIGVDARARLFMRARPLTPAIEVGAWGGSQFQDATTNSAESLYNRVIVEATGPDGLPVSEVRTASVGQLTAQGVTRTKLLGVSAAITATAAQQIGDLWLAENSDPPMKGTLIVQGTGGARTLAGVPIPASRLLLLVGERVRLSHLIDPATGGAGRDATIRSVTYDHASDTATVELDNERGRLEALLERLAIVTTQALR